MGLFSTTPEERAAKEREKAERARKLAEAEFAASYQGRARAARAAGHKVYQVSMPLSTTTGTTLALQAAVAKTSAMRDFSNEIEAIESEGWHLAHASYVYRMTGSVSRDKLLSSGQQEAIHGEVLGIYIFRAV
jgi:hypothetical protein